MVIINGYDVTGPYYLLQPITALVTKVGHKFSYLCLLLNNCK